MAKKKAKKEKKTNDEKIVSAAVSVCEFLKKHCPGNEMHALEMAAKLAYPEFHVTLTVKAF